MRLQPFCFIKEEIDRVYDCIRPFKGTGFVLYPVEGSINYICWFTPSFSLVIEGTYDKKW